MAETLISPGVLARENDNSFITQQPVTVGAAIIGPTVKGPVEIPTVVTTYSDYLNKFGSTFLSGGIEYSYFTSIAAYNYFQQGGESLLVSRVVSGSFTSATASIASSGSGVSFTLKTISEGTIMNNNMGTEISGALVSGSADNVRWQIVGTDNSAGTFTLLIRQGDDNTVEPIVLETWSNISLDPTQPNFIARVVGDSYQQFSSTDGAHIETLGNYPNQSRYVYVDSVNSPTPYYFDNNGNFKPQYTSSLPAVGSGSFGGAVGNLFGANAAFYNNVSGSTNLQGIAASDYNNMISLMANQDDYRFNVVTMPGLTIADNASQTTTLVNNIQSRGDAIVSVFELPNDGGSLKTIVWGGPTGVGWEVEESLGEVIKKINDVVNSKSCGCK